ncbi:prepilin-type N-terminal cleavage/methylation domain-containing protein [Opitutaceae bacterium TAV1]|nr:prepilin-type N-terminal cleavage/methylation domain-containing protein [Opitutaceae bacterium TAV1]
MKKNNIPDSRRLSVSAFTLIELLTVIAIIGILAAIIIPTVGKVRESAKKIVALNNLRQIVQASLIYASDSGDRLPGKENHTTSTPAADAEGDKTLAGVCFQLAYAGGLNDGSIWFAGADDNGTNNKDVSTVMDKDKAALESNFDYTKTSYEYVVGLMAADPSTTPVAFTRSLTKTGWDDGPWKKDGGHIGFLGGNVGWYSTATIKAGKTLIQGGAGTAGSLTDDITLTLPSSTNCDIYKPAAAATP